MNLLISTLKIIFTFATVFFAALPFVFEYHTYLKDKKRKQQTGVSELCASQ